MMGGATTIFPSPSTEASRVRPIGLKMIYLTCKQREIHNDKSFLTVQIIILLQNSCKLFEY